MIYNWTDAQQKNLLDKERQMTQNTYFKYHFDFVTWESNSCLQPVWNFLFCITLSFAEQFINVMTILSLLVISKLTVLLEEVRLPVAGYVYLGIALKNHAPVLFQSCRKRKYPLYYITLEWTRTEIRNKRQVVTAIMILTLTLWPLRVDWHLISPYNITP